MTDKSLRKQNLSSGSGAAMLERQLREEEEHQKVIDTYVHAGVGGLKRTLVESWANHDAVEAVLEHEKQARSRYVYMLRLLRINQIDR